MQVNRRGPDAKFGGAIKPLFTTVMRADQALHRTVPRALVSFLLSSSFVSRLDLAVCIWAAIVLC
jgi:hypothetical protein